MARAGILYSHVAQAAATLAVNGKNPTVDGVRETLGGTGSKSTIAPMLKRWKAEHQDTVAEAQSGLPAELIQAVKAVYDKLRDDLTTQLQTERDVHRMELKRMADQLAHADANRAVLTDTQTRLTMDLAAARDEHVRLQNELHAVTVTLAAAQSDNAGLRERLTDRAAELQSLCQQLAHARTQFEHFQEAAACQRTEERQAAESRMARLEQDLSAARRDHAGQQATIVEQQSQLSYLNTAQESLQQTLDVAQSELVMLRPKYDQLVYQAKELDAGRAELAQQLTQSRHALSDATKAKNAAQQHAAMFEGQLTAAMQRADKADQERLTLLESLTQWREKDSSASEAAHRSDVKS